MQAARKDRGYMTKAKSTRVGPEPEPVNPCRVTIWYEDASAHARALQVCQVVAHEVGPHLTLNFTEWRFEDLDKDAPANQAIKDAARADIVLISTRSAVVPAKTRECLE